MRKPESYAPCESSGGASNAAIRASDLVTTLRIPSQEATQAKPGGVAYAGSWQSRVFIKQFRGLAEFSTAMGRQLQQFSEKSGCSLLKNGHFDGLRFQG
jgi:hypothetical protein